MMLIESIKKKKNLEKIKRLESLLHHHYMSIDHQQPMLIQFVVDLFYVVDNEDHLNNSHQVNQVQNPFLDKNKKKRIVDQNIQII
jgi:hypothetical protein